MMSLKGLVLQKILKTNCQRFCKFIKSDTQVLNRFFQKRNLAVDRENRLNVFRKSITHRNYSTKISGVSDTPKSKDSQVERNEVELENEKSDYEDEDEYDDFNDEYGDFSDEYDDEDEDHKKKTKEEIFEEIANGDPEILKKLKILEFEMACLKEQGFKVPTDLNKNHWLELMNASDSQKKKLLSFLSLNEHLRKMNLEKSKLRHIKAQKKKETSGFHYYALSGHTMFLRIYPKSLNKLLHLRQLKASQKIIFDCSYQEHMSKVNVKNTAKQLLMSLSMARTHRYPCQVEFCNLNRNDLLGKILPKYITNIYDESFYCNTTEKSPLDIYPRNKLVYLSPHAPSELVDFNKDDIYIIGAFVDKGTSVKASLAKAKEFNFRVAKLPIDHYLYWKQGTKNLPLNVVLKILLDMSYYNDWNIAFKNLSNRLINDGFTRPKYKDVMEI